MKFDVDLVWRRGKKILIWCALNLAIFAILGQIFSAPKVLLTR